MTNTNKARRRPPLSLRLSDAERTELCNRAGNLPISTYIKSVLFDGTGAPSRKARRVVSRDRKELAQILAKLGQSNLRENLDELASAARSGSLFLDDDVLHRLTQACEEIRAIHVLLMQALGRRQPADSKSFKNLREKARDAFNAENGQ